MALKKILTVQEDFTGEFKNTDRTEGLWKFNEKDSDFIDDTPKTVGSREYSYPTGFPRQEVDGTDESHTKTAWNMHPDNQDLDLSGGASFTTTDTLFKGRALDLSTGTAYLPSGTVGMGPARSMGLWFQVTAADLVPDWVIIATQRTNGNHGFHVSLYRGALYTRYYSGGQMSQAFTPYKLTAGKWYFVEMLTNITSSGTGIWETRLDGEILDSGYLDYPMNDNGNSWELGAWYGEDRFYGKLGSMFIQDRFYRFTNYYEHAFETKKLIDEEGVTIRTFETWYPAEYNSANTDGKAAYGDSSGARVEYTFTGEKVTWRTNLAPDAGIAEIYIDSKYAGEADLYSPTRKYAEVAFESRILTRGQHVISIRWTGDRNPASSGTRIYNDGVRIVPGLNTVYDYSGNRRPLVLHNWKDTSAKFVRGSLGNRFRFNQVDPDTEKTYLQLTNDGSLFAGLGRGFIFGTWVNPTTYGSQAQFVPILSTRDGPGTPMVYVSFTTGKLNVRLFNSSGAAIYNVTESAMAPVVVSKNYFIAVYVDLDNNTIQNLVGTEEDKTVYKSPIRNIEGTVNRSCTADLYVGMLEGDAFFSGTIDDLFYEKNTEHNIETMERYFYSSIAGNGGDVENEVDGISVSGSVILSKENNAYKASGTFNTPIIDLGTPISGNGKIVLLGEVVEGKHEVKNIQSRTADDFKNPVWSFWEDVGPKGEVKSPPRRYMQIRATLTTNDPTTTPELMEIQIHETIQAPYSRLGYARPVILDRNLQREAVLENAYDVIIYEEVNGADYVTFKLPYQDDKRHYLDNEKKIQFTDDVYLIRTITDTKSESGEIITEVYAEAEYYNLAFSDPIEEIEFDSATAVEVMEYGARNSGWTVGQVDNTKTRNWEVRESNVLAYMRRVQEIWGGDLVFDAENHTINLLEKQGQDNGVLFAYRKNMKSIQKIVDTKELITKLYVYGRDGLSIADANNGREFLEDYSFTSEIRSHVIKHQSFTNPFQLKEWGEERLEELKQPRISYIIQAIDLSVLSGHEHEQFNIGDTITVDDHEMGIRAKTRVIRREYNTQEPWKTVIELSTKLKELGDQTESWDQAGDALEGADYVSSQDMSELMVFNYLLNSRADDGFAYWINGGFEIDNDNGFSGPASFKCVGVPGGHKSLVQEIRPSHRDYYTISTKIATRNLEKGPNGKVGIEVTLHYEDGTSEVKFIEL